MPPDPKWADYFAQTVSSIASQFKEFPAIDRDELEAIEERVNALWLDPDGQWPEFQRVVGKYKMFWFKLRR